MSVTPDRIMQIGMGFWASKALLTGCELKLFELVERKGALDLEAIEKELKLNPRSSRDFLDALVSLKVLERSEDGLYSNGTEASEFLVPGKPHCVAGMLEMANARLYPFWGNLGTALRTGKQQNEAAQGDPDIFEAIYADPARLKQFLEAMSGVSHAANQAIAQKVDWSGVSTAVDVGCAQGDLSLQVALANPSVQCVGFDLPPCGPIFDEYMARNKVSERVRFKGGDFFKDPLPKGEAITMAHILHDWDLPTKKMLIKKAFEALPSGGKLIIYDALIDDERRQNSFGLLMSLNMLIETKGGFDYSGADCIGWLKEAGFTDPRVEHLVGPDSMVVAHKP